MMADARPFDTGVKVIAGLSGEARVELASQEGVVVKGVADAAAVQLSGQPRMSIEIEWQPEGGPGGDPQLAQTQVLVDEVDGQPVLGGEAFGVGSDFIAQRFGELGVVEEANSADPQRLGHRFGVGDVDETAGEDDAVETGQRADDLVGVDFSEPSHAGTLMPIVATRRHAA